MTPEETPAGNQPEITPENPPEKNYEERPPFFASLRGAISKPDMYDIFRRVKLSKTISFFLLFLFFVAIVYTINSTLIMGRWFDKMADYYRDNFPAISIKGDTATVNAEMPVIKEIPDTPGYYFIIDTTGKVQNLDEYKAGILMKQKELVFKPENGKIQTYQYSTFTKSGDFTIDKDGILTWKKAAVSSLPPFIFIFGYLSRIIIAAAQIILFAIVGMFLARSKDFELPFEQHVNISIYAAIPAFLAMMIIDVSGLGHYMTRPGSVNAIGILFSYTIYFIYVLEGTRAVINKSKKDLNES